MCAPHPPFPSPHPPTSAAPASPAAAPPEPARLRRQDAVADLPEDSSPGPLRAVAELYGRLGARGQADTPRGLAAAAAAPLCADRLLLRLTPPPPPPPLAAGAIAAVEASRAPAAAAATLVARHSARARLGLPGTPLTDAAAMLGACRGCRRPPDHHPSLFPGRLRRLTPHLVLLPAA